MQINERYENETHTRDLFFHVLYRWRSIIAVAIIVALVVGGYAFLKNRRIKSANEAARLAYEQTLLSETGKPETEKMKNASEINNEVYQSLIRYNLDYSNYSIIMNVNPDQEWQAYAVYAVVLEDDHHLVGEQAQNTTTRAIASVYGSAIWYNWDEEKLAAIYGEKSAKYAAELFSGGVMGGNAESFSIKAIGLTKEMAEQGLQYLKDAVLAFYKDKGSLLGSYHLELVNEYTIQALDTNAENRRVTVVKNIPVYQKAITGGVSPGYSQQALLPMVKYAVIGLVFGCAVMILIYILQYILGGKLQNREFIQGRYGLPVYGEMNHSRAFRPGKGLDGLIEKWEFHKNKESKAAVIEKICALLEENAGDAVLLTGTVQDKKLQEFCNGLRECLGDKVSVLAQGDGLYNNRAIEEAKKAGAVILVEEKYVSNQKDISRMIEILNICGSPILGAVLI